MATTTMEAPASCRSVSNLVQSIMLLYCLTCLAGKARAQAQHLSDAPPLPQVDPLSDGIYVRAVELPAEAGVDVATRRRLVAYDFRPAFPPYAKASLAELLLLFPAREAGPAPREGAATTRAAVAEETGDPEEARARADVEGKRGMMSPRVEGESVSPEEGMALGNEATISGGDVSATAEHEATGGGDVAAVVEHEAVTVAAGKNEQTPSSEVFIRIAQEAEVENRGKGEAERLFEDNPAPATEDNDYESKVEDEATKERRSEDNPTPATDDENHHSEIMTPTIGDVVSSEAGGSHLAVPPEDVQETARKEEPKKEEEAKDEENAEVIDEVRESHNAEDELHHLEEDASSVSSSASTTEGPDATTAASESIEQKAQQSPQNQTMQAGEETAMEEERPVAVTVAAVDTSPSFRQVGSEQPKEAAASPQNQTTQAGEKAATEEDQSVAAMDSSPFFHRVESEQPEEAAASPVGSDGEDHILSDASEDGGGDDVAHYDTAAPTETRQEEEGAEFDLGHAEDEADKNKAVTPPLVAGNASYQDNETLLNKSPQEETPGPSSEEKTKIQPRDADKAAPSSTSSQDANRQFVTGLDEIDKLFESVEVPDELDVGANGSSLQDVLVGQGLKILWKRARNFSAGVKNATKHQFENVLGALGILAEDDEAGEEEIRLSVLEALVDMQKLKDGGGGGKDLLPSAHNDRKKQEDDAREVPPPTAKRNSEARPKKNKKKQKGENMRRKKKRDLPSTTPKNTQTLWKFARRKWERAMHMLDDFFGRFDGVGDDEAGLPGLPAGFGDLHLGEQGPRKDVPNFGGKFGAEVDESFLKARYEAMAEQNK